MLFPNIRVPDDPSMQRQVRKFVLWSGPEQYRPDAIASPQRVCLESISPPTPKSQLQMALLLLGAATQVYVVSQYPGS